MDDPEVSGEVSGDPLKTPNDSQYFAPIDWKARLNERTEAYQAQQAARKAERAITLERRRHGKATYHAAKLKRAQTNRGDNPTDQRSAP